MAQWGVVQSCLFCGELSESRDHLFFACPYTFTVWLAVVGDLLVVDADPDWETTLVFQTAIYYIWKERNDMRHMGKPKTVDQITKLIEKTVKHRIMSTRYFENPKLLGLLQRWFRGR
ncbi:uncharacterized protein LOC117127510 [Brassica rapa]|uniref:uncharacterized protein LOC117127510 n=1 Tax=Brassica campestris TaxID=3711 RepID=UPI00142D4B34|nr:uncharacterized protein LOC117127510 [Brassica rapa]